MSVRSNADRLGVNSTPENQEAPPIPVQQPDATSAPLSYVTPTEFVELPSKGLFYGAQHPLHNVTSMEIRHMTAKDEDILTSETLLKQGIALDRMLQNIIVDKRIKVKDLLVGDKNALVVAARVHGYGPEYRTKVNCPSCATPQEYIFDLNSLENNNELEDVYASYDISQTEDNTFLLPLPKTEYTVELKLLTGVDEKKLTELSRRKKKHKLMEANTTSQLKMLIVSVNGLQDKKTIEDFVNRLPAMDSRYIRRVYTKLMPTISLDHEFICSECSYETELEVPFTTDFFWSNE